MKKNILKLIVTGIIVVAPALMIAQPPPSLNSSGTAVDGNPIKGGGSAPIGSGIALLLTLGAGYGAKRIYDARKKLAE
ncbi:MAG TPA: hypothetical protein DEO70_00745 [Bacteroidales bacterium]|nr:MAG: hypothetical protein A2X11_04750 [Bacteroidetes bacterium GWE2_42_24]OFY30766.1 MAG: hypothetical protein A2X09_16845 [Bacteroidetes bacterium GWF2_43_11]HBZ65336.1 hypothetical protein [Bacteroidales bacterium]